MCVCTQVIKEWKTDHTYERLRKSTWKSEYICYQYVITFDIILQVKYIENYGDKILVAL